METVENSDYNQDQDIVIFFSSTLYIMRRSTNLTQKKTDLNAGSNLSYKISEEYLSSI